MSARAVSASERWFRLLLHFYPADFRDEVGASFVEAYLDRIRDASQSRGTTAVALIWIRALLDSLYNGIGERLRPAAAWRRAGEWGRDAELAARRLYRAPVFSASMIGTLVVGLGAFAVVLTVITKILIEPLPYKNPSELYYVWRDYGKVLDLKRGWVSGPDVSELGKAGGPIASAVGLRIDRRVLADMRAQEGTPEEVDVMISSANLFDVLGTRPVLGRGFAANDAGTDRPPVVVLGYDLWQSRFAGRASVLGEQLKLNGAVYTVIGVTGRDFHFVRHNSLGAPQGASLYIPFPYELGTRPATQGAFAVLIRARHGASPGAVAAAVASIGRDMDARFFKARGISLYPVGLQADLVGPVRPALMLLGIAGVFLVFVLAVNLATLLLARIIQRDRELAVLRALGASPSALTRAALIEAGLLGTIGGVGAALAAIWGTRVLMALAPLDLPRRESIAVDWKVAVTIVGIGALLGLLAGLAPAFWASRASLATLLRNAAVRGGGKGRLRRALVVAQVGLCLMLLSAGGLVVRSFGRLLQSQPGFEPKGVLTWRVPVASWRFPNNASAVAFDDQLQREIAAIPGVESVGAASAVPLTANTDQTDVVAPGAPGNTGRTEHDAPLADVMYARSGWFKTLGIKVLAGRDFAPSRPGSRREAVIDRSLAAYFFPSSSPLGATLVANADTLTVVGVVDHARQYDLHRDGRPQVYMRDEDDTYGPLYFALRTKRTPLELVPEVRGVIRRLDRELAISDVRTLDDIVSGSLQQQRLSAVLIGGFSLGALLLAAMGLFGVVASAVVRRRHEMAVRLALGAERGRVLRLIINEGAVLVALGVAIALPGVILLGRLMRAVVIGVSPFDPVTLAAVALGLGVVSLAACYLPARRAASIDPARALRED
ncbi:MAG TPA: ADOP family duplicated permease [Gemmatimonadaceae bacterium]